MDQRVIKFRGIRKESPNEFLYATGVVIIDKDCAYIPDIKNISADGYDMKMSQVKPETIGQFTGLLDMNGKEIYKGDKLRILYTDWPSNSDDSSLSLDDYKKSISTVGYVDWDEHSTGWIVRVKSKYSVNDDGTVMSSIIHGTHGEREVIGHIYE